TVHSRNSYNNSGVLATVNVHHEYGSEYNNAYWSPSAQQFFFYDGDGASLNGLTITDVAAHEFTHAVDEYSANLTYQYESGALNESFSDIFGALVEFKNQPDGRSSYPNATAGYADWLLAEDCMISATAMRDMRNPASTTTLGSGSQQPSKYLGTYWYSGSGDNGGVHYNSGVQNFFFYLLCEGGSGNNDGTSYSVTGIGIDNAAQVAYRALTVYCTASTDHSAARTAWISAATDLNSGWVSAVQAAWDAVGVSSGGGGTARYTPLMDDFDGDYYGDPTLFDSSAGYFYIRLSRYGYALASLYSGASSAYRSLSGFWDYDWNSDPTLYDTASGYWYMALSTYNYSWYYLYWYVTASSLPVCADFDGDMYADPTLYSPSSGYWYILLSSYGWEYYYSLGYSASAGLLPFGGDFDGDWYADPTFYSPNSGNWYILLSTYGYQYYYTLWFGASGYTAALGDFDGDFRADPILRSTAGHWYVLLSSLSYQNYYDFSW
ncbi:MAG: M4 family metallopeptidase, partial [Verrucomicrobia bacterium]|nr:M4 family metallopeptidase [Verrucomicrobiota bacterium]